MNHAVAGDQVGLRDVDDVALTIGEGHAIFGDTDGQCGTVDGGHFFAVQFHNRFSQNRAFDDMVGQDAAEQFSIGEQFFRAHIQRFQCRQECIIGGCKDREFAAGERFSQISRDDCIDQNAEIVVACGNVDNCTDFFGSFGFSHLFSFFRGFHLFRSFGEFFVCIHSSRRACPDRFNGQVTDFIGFALFRGFVGDRRINGDALAVVKFQRDARDFARTQVIFKLHQHHVETTRFQCD